MSFPESTIIEMSEAQIKKESKCNHFNITVNISECGQFEDYSCPDCGHEHTVDKENHQE